MGGFLRNSSINVCVIAPIKNLVLPRRKAATPGKTAPKGSWLRERKTRIPPLYEKKRFNNDRLWKAKR
jgi:hypothetical protein